MTASHCSLFGVKTMKKSLIIVFAALLCSAVVVPALAQPLPDELIIHPWTLPQHFCIYLVPGENMEVFIVGGPIPPNSPEFTVAAGCDQISTVKTRPAYRSYLNSHHGPMTWLPESGMRRSTICLEAFRDAPVSAMKDGYTMATVLSPTQKSTWVI
jgi:hypothetical protein